MTDEKYIVIKTEDASYDVTNRLGRRVYRFRERDVVPDAVVIRKQDVFAAAALHTYASSIAVAVNIIDQLSEEPPFELAKKVQRLREVADYFHEAAVEAEETGYKVPD